MSKSNEMPELCELFLRVLAWSNWSTKHEQPLVSPEAFSEIDDIMLRAEQVFNDITLPDFPKGHRLIMPAHFMFRQFDAFNVLNEELDKALRVLVNRWPALVAEAAARLGKHFDSSDYPTADDLPRRFKISWELGSQPIVLAVLTEVDQQAGVVNMCNASELLQKLKQAANDSAEQRRLLGLDLERMDNRISK